MKRYSWRHEPICTPPLEGANTSSRANSRAFPLHTRVCMSSRIAERHPAYPWPRAIDVEPDSSQSTVHTILILYRVVDIGRREPHVVLLSLEIVV